MRLVSQGLFGVELEPAERVLYIDTPDYKTEKVVMWTLGALFLVHGIAVIIIARDGVRHEFTTKNARTLGPFVVNVLTNLDAVEQFPSVA